jgi:hypothetical protein
LSATGAQGGTLNAGDVITVTANMSEATTVTGTPQMALVIGGTVVQANYASGSGTNALTFSYTILANQTDANGISLATNALTLNGATLRDAVGNNANLATAAVADSANFKVDTTAPTAPTSAPAAFIDNVGGVTSNSSTAATTDDTTPGIIIGTSLAGTPSLYVDGVKVASTYDVATGAITPTGALTAGPHAFTYSLTDVAGNESARSAALNLVVNNAPVLSDTTLNFGAIIQDAGVPTGAVGSLVSSFVGGITDADAGAVKGIAITGVANGTLYYSTNSGTQWTAVSNASNTNALLLSSDAATRIYFKPDTGFSGSASSAVTFRAWDQATGSQGTYASTAVNGNEASFSSATDTISEQVVRPVTISAVSTDNVVTKNEALVLNGTANPGATVALSINSGSSVDVVADASGNWSYNSNMVRYVMVRKVIGAADNTVFAITDLSVYDGAGTKISVGKNITQSASLGNTSFANINDSDTGSIAEKTVSTGADVWVQIDLGGLYQVSQITATPRLTNWEQTTRLSGATIFASATDMSASTKAQLDASTSVSKSVIFVDTIVRSHSFNNPGSTSSEALLNSGSNSITATETVSGVISTVSSNVRMIPNTPATAVSYIDNVGSITSTTSTAASTDDTTPGINVGVALVDTPKLYVDGVYVAATYVSATGVLTPNVAIAQGVHAITYTVTDAAGSESAKSAPISVTIDTTAPTAPVTAPSGYIDNIGTITSANSTVARTDDTVPGIIIGTSLAGTPSLYVDGIKVQATYDAVAGTLTPAVALTSGLHAITYTLTDAVGNESGYSPAINITIDTTAANAPSIALVSDDVGSVTGAVAIGGTTDDTVLVVRVDLTNTNALLGDSVQLNNGQSSIAASVNLSAADITAGYVDITTTTLTNANTYAFNAKITDVAGNVSVASANHGVTIELNPTILASSLDNVTNLDVRTNLVLNYSESVSAVAGKYIHIVNDGGIGFLGETTTHTFDILVTDATQVTISGGRITLNPTFDLDLSNNYHISIDDGAFLGATSGLASSAFDGTSALNFSTVTPGVSISDTTKAVQAQEMTASGGLQNGLQWLDVTGGGVVFPAAHQYIDAGLGDFAFVVKDADTRSSGYGDIFLTTGTASYFDNFGTHDLLYVDNQQNQLTATADLEWMAFVFGEAATADDGGGSTIPYEVNFNDGSSFRLNLDTSILLSSTTSALTDVVFNNGVAWTTTGMVITA